MSEKQLIKWLDVTQLAYGVRIRLNLTRMSTMGMHTYWEKIVSIHACEKIYHIQRKMFK